MTANKNWHSLASATFIYSLLLAAVMEAAHAFTRLLLSLAAGSASLDPVTLLGELASKIAWSVLGCEAVVLLSILARRRWLLIVVAAGAALFVGSVLGALLRSILETALGRASSFIWQAALDSSTLLGSKYLLIGAAVAWAERAAESTLRHYLAAGLVAAMGAAGITWFAMNADPVSKLGTIVVDFVFPLGCSAVVWKVRQMAEPLIEKRDEAKGRLINI